jgi:hypothetical protein
MVERDQVAKAIIRKPSLQMENTVSRIKGSQWLDVAGLLLSSAFILALVFK